MNRCRYVKGLCIYSVRAHCVYGRLLDVPVFVAASAADAEGVAADLLQFLQSICDRSVCSGVRFWTMGAETWSRRLADQDIVRTDHGIFLPTVPSVAQIANCLSTSMQGAPAIIHRLSR
ncbi:MAG: hypothetical protein JO366_09515 [Methylobacteriaceae bacterium]|nr:hypothetical protein [Methylobacteriaceae bacterium]